MEEKVQTQLENFQNSLVGKTLIELDSNGLRSTDLKSKIESIERGDNSRWIINTDERKCAGAFTTREMEILICGSKVIYSGFGCDYQVISIQYYIEPHSEETPKIKTAKNKKKNGNKQQRKAKSHSA